MILPEALYHACYFYLGENFGVVTLPTQFLWCRGKILTYALHTIVLFYMKVMLRVL